MFTDGSTTFNDSALLNADSESLQQRIAQKKRAEEREREEAEAAAEERQTAIAAALSAGKELFAKGEFAAAEKQFDIALQYGNLDKRHEVINNRAACAMKLGNYADAVADASTAVALEPSYIKGHYRLALAYRALGKVERACGACRTALTLQPTHAQLLALLSDMESANGTGGASTSTDISDARVGTSEQQPTPEAAAASASEKEANQAKVKRELEAMGWTVARALTHPGQIAAKQNYDGADPARGTVQAGAPAAIS